MASPEGPESLVERAVRLIGSAIVRGDHAPGATLPVETELCRTIQVGRNALREAVKILASKGLLRTNRRAGTIVLETGRWNLLDPDVLGWALAAAPPAGRADLLAELIGLRALIEPEVAARAAMNATLSDMVQFGDAYHAVRRGADDPARAVEAQIGFHRCLFTASRHRVFASLLPAFVVLMRATVPRGDVATYRAIAEAMYVRDAAAARRAAQALAAVEPAEAPPRVRVRAGRREVSAGDTSV